MVMVVHVMVGNTVVFDIPTMMVLMTSIPHDNDVLRSWVEPRMGRIRHGNASQQKNRQKAGENQTTPLTPHSKQPLSLF